MKKKTETITIRDPDIIKKVIKIQKTSGDAWPGSTARRLIIQALNLSNQKGNIDAN